MPVKKTATRGGARPGAGRKPSGLPGVRTCSISMPIHAWNRLDSIRGDASRGKIMEKIIDLFVEGIKKDAID